MLLEVDHSVVVRSYYVRIVDLDFCLPLSASVAQLAEHALRKRMVVGSIPTGGYTESAVDILPGSSEDAHSMSEQLREVTWMEFSLIRVFAAAPARGGVA